MSLVKSTLVPSVSEDFNIQFRLEVFNALNRANFGLPNRIMFSSTGRVGSAGRINDTTTTARQIQLALKLLF